MKSLLRALKRLLIGDAGVGISRPDCRRPGIDLCGSAIADERLVHLADHKGTILIDPECFPDVAPLRIRILCSIEDVLTSFALVNIGLCTSNLIPRIIELHADALPELQEVVFTLDFRQLLMKALVRFRLALLCCSHLLLKIVWGLRHV